MNRTDIVADPPPAHTPDRRLEVEGQTFGARLYGIRTSRGMNQRSVAGAARIAASILCEIENERRIPPEESVVLRLCGALGTSEQETDQLVALALRGRSRLGMRVSRSTPAHVAILLREISNLGQFLTEQQAAAIRCSLKEVIMK